MVTRISLEQYNALTKAERTALRRAAFGAVVFKDAAGGYDLEHLKALLIADNETTGDFGTKWTNQSEADEAKEAK